MLADLDYYLLQIATTAGNPPQEQARYVPDCWWWLHLYQENRSPAQFEQLLDAIRSGHITIPLNPFVTLYGALPTEAAIRAGYYPGRIAREFDPFRSPSTARTRPRLGARQHLGRERRRFSAGRGSATAPVGAAPQRRRACSGGRPDGKSCWSSGTT
jgi:hypothetical protein